MRKTLVSPRLPAAAGLAAAFAATTHADHAFDDSAFMTLQFRTHDGNRFAKTVGEVCHDR